MFIEYELLKSKSSVGATCKRFAINGFYFIRQPIFMALHWSFLRMTPSYYKHAAPNGAINPSFIPLKTAKNLDNRLPSRQ
jgi:hypothetical protein